MPNLKHDGEFGTCQICRPYIVEYENDPGKKVERHMRRLHRAALNRQAVAEFWKTNRKKGGRQWQALTRSKPRLS